MSGADATLLVRVLRKATEAQDICGLELAAVDGATLPAFSAGSHLDVHLPGGSVRQYSLCNDPAEDQRHVVAVLREPASRGGSLAVHDAVQEGDTLHISVPKNHFSLAPEARRHLLLAGGIGVTPLLCMAERLAVKGADFTMHYATRSPGRAAFMQRIRDSAFADRVSFHFDDGALEQKLDFVAALSGHGPGTHLYVCGPKGFMDAVLAAARAQGVRHLPDMGVAGRGGSPRRLPDAAGAGGQRPVHAVLLARQVDASGARPLTQALPQKSQEMQETQECRTTTLSKMFREPPSSTPSCRARAIGSISSACR